MFSIVVALLNFPDPILACHGLYSKKILLLGNLIDVDKGSEIEWNAPTYLERVKKWTKSANEKKIYLLSFQVCPPNENLLKKFTYWYASFVKLGRIRR